MDKEEPHLRQPVPEVEDIEPPLPLPPEDSPPIHRRIKTWHWLLPTVLALAFTSAGVWQFRKSGIRVHRNIDEVEADIPVPSPTSGESIERVSKDVTTMDQKLAARDATMLEALNDLKRAVTHRGSFPRINVMDENERLVLTAEMPGFERDQIDIDVEASSVQIKGVRKLELPGKAVLSERVDDHFERSIPLPSPVDPAKANAYYRDGLLTIELPKAASDVRKVSPDIQP